MIAPEAGSRHADHAGFEECPRPRVLVRFAFEFVPDLVRGEGLQPLPEAVGGE